MKKLFLLLIVAMFTYSAQAQLLLNETFNYNSSKLCNVAGDPNANADPYNVVGTWYNTGKASDSNTSSSHIIEAEPQFYEGYINSAAGKTVKITNLGVGTNNRAEVCRFTTDALKYKPSNYTGSLYYAFMMLVNDAHSWDATAGADANEWRDVFCIAEGGSELPGNSYRGRFFIQHDPNDATKINYSIGKNTSFTTSAPPEAMGKINVGQTYLVVIKQDFTTTTGTVSVIMNPAIAATEPTTGWINGKPGDTNTFSGTYAVALRSRSLGNAADIRISGLRVAKSYASVVGAPTGVKNILANSNIKTIARTIVTNEVGNIKVFSFAGKEMLSAKTNGTIETNLNKGFYLVRFVSVNGQVSSAKIEIK